MQLQPWVIASWPIIERPSDPSSELTADLKHLGTTVSADCDEFGRLCGHTIWGDDDLEIGLAWDWTEAHDGVFALSDPMGVVSNITFIDETGASIPEFRSAVHLNRIAHEIPWQAEVVKATHAVRTSNPWSRRIESMLALHVRGGDGSAWEASQRRRAGPESGLQSL
jgi:hypothetical protein